MVNTGAQSVAYGTARPGGEYGLAISQAAWHRSFTSGRSVPLRGVQGHPGEPGAELVAGMTLLLATGPISVA
jgi:hypothetical protein